MPPPRLVGPRRRVGAGGPLLPRACRPLCRRGGSDWRPGRAGGGRRRPGSWDFSGISGSLAAHAHAVLGRITPADQAIAGGWVRFGGLRFLLATAQTNLFLMPMPLWCTGVFLPLAVLGLASWRGEPGRRVGLTVAALPRRLLGGRRGVQLLLGVPLRTPARPRSRPVRSSALRGLVAAAGSASPRGATSPAIARPADHSSRDPEDARPPQADHDDDGLPRLGSLTTRQSHRRPSTPSTAAGTPSPQPDRATVVSRASAVEQVFHNRKSMTGDEN